MDPDAPIASASAAGAAPQPVQPGPVDPAAPVDLEAPWQERLAGIVALMREISTITDPQEMVKVYGRRVRKILNTEHIISLSRRGLEYPFYKVTRSPRFAEEIDPWKQPHRLPVYKGGLLAELIYADYPRIINDLVLGPDDPAYAHLSGMRSLNAVPHFDNGVGLNMVISASTRPGAYSEERFPELVWLSNLFGRTTNNLVLARRLAEANAALEREMRVVADIQRSLLPRELPVVSTLDLAASYQTSAQAGGDYYDFFPLGKGRWGVLMADVAGHGTPAAVLMAVVHAIAHLVPGEPTPPARVLEFVNRQLGEHYTNDTGTFVTALFGEFDERTRTFAYASAGHCPPMHRDAATGRVESLDVTGAGLPLGIDPGHVYSGSGSVQLAPGDALLLYTDGITEARAKDGSMYGEPRLMETLGRCGGWSGCTARAAMTGILEDVAHFCAGRPADDDRTILLGMIR